MKIFTLIGDLGIWGKNFESSTSAKATSEIRNPSPGAWISIFKRERVARLERGFQFSSENERREQKIGEAFRL